jgi:hypothetical protein
LQVGKARPRAYPPIRGSYAIRDSDSTSYTGAIETAVEFGKRIYREAWKRGWSRAKKKVVIGDGAEWIWNLVAEHFPGTIQIVDLYHAHLWEVARQLYPHDDVKQKAWMKVHQKRLLDKGKIEKLVGVLRSIDTANSQMDISYRTDHEPRITPNRATLPRSHSTHWRLNSCPLHLFATVVPKPASPSSPATASVRRSLPKPLK